MHQGGTNERYNDELNKASERNQLQRNDDDECVRETKKSDKNRNRNELDKKLNGWTGREQKNECDYWVVP